MEVVRGVKPPVWYWIVAVLALLWALAGCFAFVTQMTMGAAELARLPAAQREVWEAMPGWVEGAYAVAVGAGLLGSAALLLRRRWAWELFALSLAGIVVQFGWTFLATPILGTLGPAATVPFPAIIAIVCIAEIVFARMAAARGWLS